MQSTLRCAMICALLLCCGCAPPAYWVPGLTLPTGATIVAKSETTEVQGMAAMLPFKGKIDKVLNVTFNCSGDWAAVSSHIDSCMTGQGYTDQVASMASSLGGMPGAGAAGAATAQMFSMMRMYSKDGNKYTVMLMNMDSVMQTAAAAGGRGAPPGGAANMPGMGSYMLGVIRTK